MLKVSTKTRYGLRAMIDLAIHYRGKPIMVKEIAERQNVSSKYLEHILLALKKAGLVESIVGAKGGYILTKNPADIKVLHIFEIFEGSISPVSSGGNKGFCMKEDDFATRELYCKIKQVVTDLLDSFTLKDLIKNRKEKELSYHI